MIPRSKYTHSFILLTFNVITGDDDGWIPMSILCKSLILLRINHEPFIYFPHIYRFAKIEKKATIIAFTCDKHLGSPLMSFVN